MTKRGWIGWNLLVCFGLLTACGSDSGDAGALIDQCLLYCDQQAECYSSGLFDEDDLAACQNACEEERFDEPDLNLSQALINCAKYGSCTQFTSCVAQGGSTSDDEYGGFSNL